MIHRRDPVRGAIVVYDADSRQLKLHRDLSLNTSLASSSQLHGLAESNNEICSYCGRGGTPPISGTAPYASSNGPNRRYQQPLPTGPENFRQSDDPSNSTGRRRTFVDANYFRLLRDASVSATPSVSRQNSPLPQSSRIGISSSAYSEGYFERFFVTERELGRGGRGAVYLVEHVLDGVSLGQFACKKIPVGDDHKWLERVLREVDLLRLTHANLVNYNHVWLENAQLTEFGPRVPCIFILQEYCDGGTLEEYVQLRSGLSTKEPDVEELKKRARMKLRGKARQQLIPRDFLSLEEIGSFFIDITAGLNHMHQHGFVHRDLKPSNCLLNLGPGLPSVLVSDFGEGQREGAMREATGATGTVGFCAPETLTRDPTTGELPQFSSKTDMFSLGMILYFLCFAQLPYQHKFDSEFDGLRIEVTQWAGFDKSKVAHIRNDLPPEIYDLLSRLLSPDPELRPSADSLLDLIGVNLERGRRRSSGVASTSIPSVPISTTRTSSALDTQPGGVFSLWRSQISSSHDRQDGIARLPLLQESFSQSLDNSISSPEVSGYEDISPSATIAALDNIPQLTDRADNTLMSRDLTLVKQEPIARSGVQHGRRSSTGNPQTLFWLWILSYVAVGLLASCLTYYLSKPNFDDFMLEQR